jgi:RNA polymerase sigma-70 factor (ECF subfamily)
MKRDATDEELMLAYGAGDAAAFDALYARHRGPVYRYLRHQLGNDGIAEELFQDVWMRVINARDRYAPTAKFATWLYTIAHNRLMDHFRTPEQRADVVELDAATADDDPPPLELTADELAAPAMMLERKRLAARILDALAALPAAQREAFVLQQEGDLTVEEIASATGVNRETAKSRLRYAFAKLRRGLTELK